MVANGGGGGHAAGALVASRVRAISDLTDLDEPVEEVRPQAAGGRRPGDFAFQPRPRSGSDPEPSLGAHGGACRELVAEQLAAPLAPRGPFANFSAVAGGAPGPPPAKPAAPPEPDGARGAAASATAAAVAAAVASAGAGSRPRQVLSLSGAAVRATSPTLWGSQASHSAAVQLPTGVASPPWPSQSPVSAITLPFAAFHGSGRPVAPGGQSPARSSVAVVAGGHSGSCPALSYGRRGAAEVVTLGGGSFAPGRSVVVSAPLAGLATSGGSSCVRAPVAVSLPFSAVRGVPLAATVGAGGARSPVGYRALSPQLPTRVAGGGSPARRCVVSATSPTRAVDTTAAAYGGAAVAAAVVAATGRPCAEAAPIFATPTRSAVRAPASPGGRNGGRSAVVGGGRRGVAMSSSPGPSYTAPGRSAVVLQSAAATPVPRSGTDLGRSPDGLGRSRLGATAPPMFWVPTRGSSPTASPCSSGVYGVNTDPLSRSIPMMSQTAPVAHSGTQQALNSWGGASLAQRVTGGSVSLSSNSPSRRAVLMQSAGHISPPFPPTACAAMLPPTAGPATAPGLSRVAVAATWRSGRTAWGGHCSSSPSLHCRSCSPG